MKAINGIKHCPRCNNNLPATSVNYYTSSTEIDGLNRYCKKCAVKNSSEANKRTGGNLKQKWRLSKEQYAFMLSQQDGKCAICGKSSGQRRLDIDHCHASGHIRGLLCNRCNQAIGLLGDNHNIIKNALSYIETPPFDYSYSPMYGSWGKEAE